MPLETVVCLKDGALILLVVGVMIYHLRVFRYEVLVGEDGEE